MDAIRLPGGVSVPLREVEVTATRSGGPGGQHANTSDTKVQLRWSPGDSAALTDTQRQRVLDRLASRLTQDGVLILTAKEHRSQHQNRAAVLARFQAVVGEALQPPRQRHRTRPTRASRQRRLDAKRHRGELKRLRRPPAAG